MKSVSVTMAKIISFIFGYFGALSFVRSGSMAFDWYASQVFGGWFRAERVVSGLWLLGCLVIFACSIWIIKPGKEPPYRKVDFSVLALLCIAGFYSGYNMLGGPIGLYGITMRTALILFPISSYVFAMFAFGELLARLRDKNLMKTLYWIGFFKTYHIWHPMGFLSVLLLGIQLYMTFSNLPAYVRLFSLFGICVLTYYATYLLNLSKEYDKVNADKIRSERFKSELITNVSHDIKTPLTSIINYVDLLKNEDLQGQAAEHLQVLERKSARLKVLIDDLMEASKAGTGNLKVDLQELDLGEIVGQVAGEFYDSFTARGLALVIRQPDDTVTIRFDSRHLYRTLENLFSNAAKYALEGTRVFAEISQQDDKIMFSLQNTARDPIELSGIDVTEQFMRGDKSRQTEGSGLGLYIAKSLAELCGASMSVNVIGDLFCVEIILDIENEI